MPLVSAWRTTEKPWYPITALTRAHVTVELALQDGWEVLGRIARHRDSRRWAWWELKPGGADWSLLAPYRTPEPDRVPRRREPVAWRPLPWTRWPDPLPEPLPGAVPLPPAPPAEEEPPPPEEVDGWPCPGLRLGERVPPASPEEAEARVLRALRRMDCEPHVGVRHRTLAADIPAEIILAARRLQDAVTAWEAYSQGRLGSLDLPPARAAWTPTRRDHGDWDYALDWWRRLPGREQLLFRYRAANPVYSWRQIGERERMSGTHARALYRAAVRRVFEIAREG